MNNKTGTRKENRGIGLSVEIKIIIFHVFRTIRSRAIISCTNEMEFLLP